MQPGFVISLNMQKFATGKYKYPESHTMLEILNRPHSSEPFQTFFRHPLPAMSPIDKRSQIRHPKRIHTCQIDRIHGLTDQIDQCLIRRQVARFRSSRQANSSFHDEVGIGLNRLA